jgi:hypothetical protein
VLRGLLLIILTASMTPKGNTISMLLHQGTPLTFCTAGVAQLSLKSFLIYLLITGPLAYTVAASTATMNQQQHNPRHTTCVTTHSPQSQGLPWVGLPPS